MDDYLEIDLKKLIKKLINKWQWILITALLVGLAVSLLGFFKKDVFKARSIVVISKPRYEVSLESNITTSAFYTPSEEFVTNTVYSAGILSELYSQWSGSDKEKTTLTNFVENSLEVTVESKGTVIILSAKAATPEDAAQIANLWAKLAVDQINYFYYGIDPNQVDKFEDQLALAKKDREETGNILVEFSTTDPTDYLSLQQKNLNAKVSDTLQKKEVLDAALFDVTGLLDYLQGLNPDDLTRQGDLLNFSLIQTRVYGSPVTSGLADSPTQLQLSYQFSTESITNQDFIKVLNSWAEVLRSEIKQLDEINTGLISEVTALQSQIKEIGKRRGLIETDFSLSDEIYKTLKVKVEEILLNDETANGNARLLASASESIEPLPHNTIRNTLIATVTSVVLTSMAILLFDWWNSDKKTEEDIKA